MLTEDEIFLAIDNVPITNKFVVDVGRAIERAVLAKLAAGEPEPVAIRFKNSNGRWRYLNYPFTKGWEFPPSLGTPIPLYEKPTANARIPEQKGESVQAYVQPAAGAVPVGVAPTQAPSDYYSEEAADIAESKARNAGVKGPQT